MASLPAALTISRRTSNEPLGAFVTFVPRLDVAPLWRRRQFQVCPTWLESISPSTSMRPSSGLALSFQSVLPLHDPWRITSSSLAEAVEAEAAIPRVSVVVAAMSAARRVNFMR